MLEGVGFMEKNQKKRLVDINHLSFKITGWIGTPASIVLHSIFFVGIFGLVFLDVSSEEILLILTTVVSLEAIYLAIFIQMTVNRNTQALEAVEDDIEDLQENVEDISEDIEEDDTLDRETKMTLSKISTDLARLQNHLDSLTAKK